MKYLVLMHSNPQPWGHPTADFLPAYQELPAQERERRGAAFDTMLDSLVATGELVSGAALGDPGQARLFRWEGERQLATDGPYAETAEHLAGFFLIDVASLERAEEVARAFSGPGETVELRALVD